MRRSTLAVLATVSLAALVSVATASQAVQPPTVVLGVLKPTEDWKVGTVQAGDTSFCAMVTKYESGVGLAFARTPEGYGTVALNLNQALFKTGENYDVSLKPQGAKARTLQARATSDRSVVVQIGQDKALYDTLKGNGTLEVSMPAADISFSLARFSRSFKSLVSCTDELGGKGNGPKIASAKVQDVEQDSLAPIDREVRKLSGDATQGKAAIGGETSLDAQLDAAAVGAPGAEAPKAASSATISPAEKTAQAVQQPAATASKAAVAQPVAVASQPAAIASQPAAIAAQPAAIAAPQVERKLLASAHSETPSVPPSDAGAMAKHWDSQQTAVSGKIAEQQDKAALQQAVADREKKIAALDAGKAAAASRETAEFNHQQQILAEKSAALKKQDDTSEADEVADENSDKPAAVPADKHGSKAAKAGLVAKTAALAKIDAQRDEDRAELAKKLAASDSEFQAKVVALEAERDGLKAKLAATATSQNKVQQKEAADSQQLASAETELRSVKQQDAEKLASLEKELNDRTAALDVLQKQGDGRTSALVKEHRQLTDQLEEKRSQIAELEQKLAGIKSEHAAEAVKNDAAAKMAETAPVKSAMPVQRKSLVIVNDDEHADPVADRPVSGGQQAELEKAQNEIAELRMKNAALSEHVAAAALPSGSSAADKRALKDMEQSQAEVADLRAKNAALAAEVSQAQNQKAAAAVQPVISAVQPVISAVQPVISTIDKTALETQRADLEKAQGELADLRARNAALSEQIATAQPAAVGKQALESQRADLEKSQGELADLRSKNAELADKLTAAQTTAQQEIISQQHELAQATAQEHAKLQEAEAEIASLKSRPEASQKLASASAMDMPAPLMPAITAPAPKKVVLTAPPAAQARNLAQTEPAAGDSAPVTAAPAVQAEADKGSYDENRAAAFLDRIMAYHHPSGAAPHASSATASSTPVFGGHATQTASAPVVPARHKLASVSEAAASDAAMTPMPAETAVAPENYKPAASESYKPAASAAAAGALPLEKILATSGVEASFKSDAAGSPVRQWTAGNLNGMYEQMPAGNFDTLAQNYIGRYRQDCPGKLAVNMTHPQTTSSGTFAQANVSCAIPSNSYSTSFVFVQEGGKFGAILHTGYPEDAAKVRTIGDNIASALGSSSGVAETPASKKADVSAPARHFTIQDNGVSAPGGAGFGQRHGDDIDTTVVQ